jgi:hypothetical protein
MRCEYKTIKCKKRNFFSGEVNLEAMDESLNAMARDGWELVDTCTSPCGVILIFKQQK